MEEATAALKMVDQAADLVLANRAFAVALAYALSLDAHMYGVRNRPFHPLQWDRKAFSHLHFFTELDVPLDPGNVVLACCLQALMSRCGTVVGSRCMRLCDECNLDRADVLAQFKVGKSSVDLVRLALACVQQNEELM